MANLGAVAAISRSVAGDLRPASRSGPQPHSWKLDGYGRMTGYSYEVRISVTRAGSPFVWEVPWIATPAVAGSGIVLAGDGIAILNEMIDQALLRSG